MVATRLIFWEKFYILLNVTKSLFHVLITKNVEEHVHTTSRWHGYIRAVLSYDQAALWMVFSVRLPGRPSVTPFSLCSHHRIIITNDQSEVHTKSQGQRSKVKLTEVKTQLNRFQTITPVWIHIWWWNDAQSLMLLRRGVLLFFKVICQISKSHAKTIVDFVPNWAFSDCNSSLNSPLSTKWCTKPEVA